MLAAHRRAADAAGTEWKSAVYRKVQEEVEANRGLTVDRMVELGRVSRSGFYRFQKDRETEPDTDTDMGLRDAIQRIAWEWPSYARPRITAELRRRGWTVNPKRIYRIRREDNLLCVRKRKFIVTTDSHHGWKGSPVIVRYSSLLETQAVAEAKAPCTGKSWQATGFYVGRVVIATAGFAPMPPLYRATSAVHSDGHRDAFLRHGGIYRSDVVQIKTKTNPGPGPPPPAGRPQAPGKRTRREDHAPLIVRDEFRPAIPRSGWSPPEPVFTDTASIF